MAAPLKNENAVKWTDDKIQELIDKFTEWWKDQDNLFWKEFFVEQEGYYPGIISYLEESNQLFSNFIKKAREKQEYRLLKKGLSNKLNPTLSIFVLKNHHDYKDKSEVENNSTVQITWKENKEYNIDDNADIA